MRFSLLEMEGNVVVMLEFKLTPCVQVKWDIIGDIQKEVEYGLMQERAL